MPKQKFNVGGFLTHYASQYYDPEKARAYYLRTRKLKGKQQSTAGMSDTQKQGVTYANKKIAQAQKAEVKGIYKDAKAKAKKITKDLRRLRDSLEMSIPANASPKLRAFLTKQNQLKMQGNLAEAQAAREVLGKDLKKAVKAARKKYETASRKEFDNIKNNVT